MSWIVFCSVSFLFLNEFHAIERFTHTQRQTHNYKHTKFSVRRCKIIVFLFNVFDKCVSRTEIKQNQPLSFFNSKLTRCVSVVPKQQNKTNLNKNHSCFVFCVIFFMFITPSEREMKIF